jgi:hypothetical protein
VADGHGPLVSDARSCAPSKGLYTRPAFFATGMTLTATKAKVALNMSTVAPRSPLRVTGTQFIAGEKVHITIKDSSGKTTAFGPYFADSAGTVTQPIIVPATTPAGSAHVAIRGAGAS